MAKLYPICRKIRRKNTKVFALLSKEIRIL